MKDFFRHYLLPHHTNNHRPKVLHHHSLLIVILFLFALLPFTTIVQRQYPAVLGISANISTQDLLNETNKQRKEHGLAPLTLNTKLTQAAQGKAENMFSNNYWAHVAPDGTTPWAFIKGAGYEYLYAGENLARGFSTASDVVNAWMNSPSHRENLLSPQYKEIGFAVKSGSLTGSDTILVVQMFGTPYISKGDDNLAEGATTVSPIPTTTQIALVNSGTPVIPTPTFVQIVPTKSIAIEPTSSPLVAAIQNKPLVDTKSARQTIAFFVIGFFIAILAIDAIIVERKQIARIVSHNVDHILFLVLLILAAILIGRGVIL